MSHSVPTEKTNIPSTSALWATIIFVGLIIAAINFVQAEGKGEGHGEHGAATEHVEGAATHEAPATEEHATVAPATEEHAAATDTTHHEAQPAAAGEAHH